jgi:hypothetical protein
VFCLKTETNCCLLVHGLKVWFRLLHNNWPRSICTARINLNDKIYLIYYICLFVPMRLRIECITVLDVKGNGKRWPFSFISQQCDLWNYFNTVLWGSWLLYSYRSWPTFVILQMNFNALPYKHINSFTSRYWMNYPFLDIKGN